MKQVHIVSATSPHDLQQAINNTIQENSWNVVDFKFFHTGEPDQNSPMYVQSVSQPSYHAAIVFEV